MNRSAQLGWLLALTLTAVGACSTSSQSTSPSTPTSAQLGLHQPRRMQGAVDIGHVDPTLMVDLLLSLKRQPGSDVDALIAQQSRPKSQVPFLTPAQFGDRFGVSAADYSWLMNWSTANGFQIVAESPSRTTLNVRGTVAVIEQSFHTRLDNYQDKHGTFRAPAVEPQFDAALSPVLRAIVGLDNASLPHPLLKPPPGNSPDANNGSQLPADLQARYGVDVAGTTYGVHGEGETVAILGAGDPPVPASDIDPFIKKFAAQVTFNRLTQYTQILLGGPNRDPDTLAENEYTENIIDISMVMALAPQASVVHVITATNGDLFEQGVPYIINQVPQAHAASVSYGFCERFADSEISSLDELFQQAKAQGQQWFFASGDDGTDGCQDTDANAILSVGWPVSSIYVIGVGGTSLVNGVEEAWANGGGGQSEIIAKPPYQIGVGPYPDDGVRDTPDVAALGGDPGVTLYVQNSLSPGWEGTSVATPLFAACWALLDQSLGGGGIRNSHEEIYTLGAAGLGFTDITTGNNSGNTPGYNALPGYDLATGWGSPNVPSLIQNWKN